MKAEAVPARRRIRRSAWDEMVRAFRAKARRSARLPRWRMRLPSRVLFAPQDLRTSDPTSGDDICANLYVFAGRSVQTGGHSPFEVASPSRAWSEALFGFDWLRHLRAVDGPAAREKARALVSAASGQRDLDWGKAGDTRVVARRLISLLCHAPFLLAGADGSFYRRYARAIGRGAFALDRDIGARALPLDRLAAAIALSYAALSCGGLEGYLRRATTTLTRELDDQVLADGGHVTRNPAQLVALLLDLLPLRLLYASRNLVAPPGLDLAIQRMQPMLQFFRHADGELALFNGAGRVAVGELATIRSYDDARGTAPQHAAPSGYDRLERGTTLVLADIGNAPPLVASAEAHAGCLSFELSSGPSRIVVNCGAPAGDDPLRDAARHTLAHSTIDLDGASSCGFLDDLAGQRGVRFVARRLGMVIVAGPDADPSERTVEADGSILAVGRHHGYAARFGVTHERRWLLSPDGARLEGIDALRTGPAAPGVEARARFHLHPSVAPRISDDAGSVSLRLADGALWRFEADEARCGLEDSVFLAVSEGRRATRQIVIRTGLAAEGETILRWRFLRA